MIDFYSWKTPNGQKVAIMLEELNLPFKLYPVDITQREQFNPDFLKINPNHKIPVIIDHEGPMQHDIIVSESGAILIYLAEKTGKFLNKEPAERIATIQWLMFQMSAVGPMLGQLHHFLRFASEKVPYAIARFEMEAKRLYQVMNQHLQQTTYFTRDYSIADMAIFPWINAHERQGIALNDYPEVNRWYQLVAARSAVQRGLTLIP